MPPDLRRGESDSWDPSDLQAGVGRELYGGLTTGDFQFVFRERGRTAVPPLLGLEATRRLPQAQVSAELLRFEREIPLAAARHGLNAGDVSRYLTLFAGRFRSDTCGDAPSVDQRLQADRQILQTYSNLMKILDVKQTDAIRRDRGKLFLSALYDVARPEHIAQGRHSRDCGAAMFQVFACVRHPEEYTDVLAQLSRNWVYKKGGTTVELPPAARRVTRQEYDWDPSMGGSDVRNLSSAMFQRVCIASLPNFQGYDGSTYLAQGRVRRQFRGLQVQDVRIMSRTITGEEMTIWELGQGTMPDARTMLEMKKDGKWPIGLIIPPTRHNPTFHAITIFRTETLEDGRMGVYLKDNYGVRKDRRVAYDDLRRTDLALKPQYDAMLDYQRYRQPQQQRYQSRHYPYGFPQDCRDGQRQTPQILLQHVLHMLQQPGRHNYGSTDGQRSRIALHALNMLQQQLQQRGFQPSRYNQYMPSYDPYDQRYQYQPYRYDPGYQPLRPQVPQQRQWYQPSPQRRYQVPRRGG